MKKIMTAMLAAALLAGCGSSPKSSAASSAVSTDTPAPKDPVTSGAISYSEYMAAEMDSEVTIAAYVQAKQSWWEEAATVYLADKDGAYFAYNMKCSETDYEKLTEGTKIIVNGTKGEWSGEIEILDGSFEFAEDGDTYVADPVDLTDKLGTDELIDFQNRKFKVEGLTVVASKNPDNEDVAYLYNYDGSGSEGDDLYFKVSNGTEEFTFTVESYLCDSESEVYKAVEALNVGDTIDAEGFLYWYEGANPHITTVTVK